MSITGLVSAVSAPSATPMRLVRTLPYFHTPYSATLHSRRPEGVTLMEEAKGSPSAGVNGSKGRPSFESYTARTRLRSGATRVVLFGFALMASVPSGRTHRPIPSPSATAESPSSAPPMRNSAVPRTSASAE